MLKDVLCNLFASLAKKDSCSFPSNFKHVHTHSNYCNYVNEAKLLGKLNVCNLQSRKSNRSQTEHIPEHSVNPYAESETSLKS